MVLLAAVAGLSAMSAGGLMVSTSGDGILVMGTSSERRVVVLITPQALLTVSGPRTGPAAALYARSSKVPPAAAAAGQTWVLPPSIRPSQDRLKLLSNWVGEELGITEAAQSLEPTWLPAGSFRPETYLSSGDLVHTVLGGPPVAIRFDPEAGDLEGQVFRQREVDRILSTASRRYGPSSPLAQIAKGDGDRVFLLAFRSNDVGLFDMLVRAPRVSVALRPRAEFVVLNVSALPKTPGAESLLQALMPRHRATFPAWALIDAAGRIRATSVRIGEDAPVNYGDFASREAVLYFVRQLRRSLPLVTEEQAEIMERGLIGALPPIG